MNGYLKLFENYMWRLLNHWVPYVDYTITFLESGARCGVVHIDNIDSANIIKLLAI